MEADKFEEIKDKYGLHASWAVWADAGDRPNSNIGDISIFDENNYGEILPKLRTSSVLVGLNISRGAISKRFSNFHDSRSVGKDFKIRYGVKNTRLWGSYMTDVIKDFDERDSNIVMARLRKDPTLEKELIERFREEIIFVGGNPILFAFGASVERILNRHLSDEFRIIKLVHYAHYIGKENYRKSILKVLGAAAISSL